MGALKRRGGSRTATAALLVALAVAACRGDDGPPPGAADNRADSLVVLLRTDSVPTARAPRDWADLLHPRFARQVAFPDPASSPEARAFMEGVLRAEAARTGAEDAGFDWLRRLDGVVAFYPESPEAGETALRRGEVAVLVTASRRAARILDGELASGVPVALAPMESGALPFPVSADALHPGLPSRDWITTWRLDVRGRG